MRASSEWRLAVPVVAALTAAVLLPSPAAASRRYPHVVAVVVDTLRLDHLSGYGYRRETSPNLDALLARGARFEQARTVEPLTGPSMTSVWTGIYPHQHGASRNSLPVHPGLPSLPKILAGRGYETAAFVGNWTLKDGLSGLGEHFGEYHEVFSRKRWVFFSSEANGDDLTDEALDWVDDRLDREHVKPFLLWVHYVEPHAPYRFHRELRAQLGLPLRADPEPEDRYDTEIGFADRAIGRLLAGLRERIPDEELLLVFFADHGESLGGHGYWGHGRFVYDDTLRVPLGFVWPGRIPVQRVDRLASTLDIAPTLMGLLGLPVPDLFGGVDWSARLFGGPSAADPGPDLRVTRHQSHKGSLHGKDEQARQKGLLEVALVHPGEKETYRLKNREHRRFDLDADPQEEHDLDVRGAPSEELRAWLAEVRQGLAKSDELPVPTLDAETLEKLKALGYVD